MCVVPPDRINIPIRADGTNALPCPLLSPCTLDHECCFVVQHPDCDGVLLPAQRPAEHGLDPVTDESEKEREMVHSSGHSLHIFYTHRIYLRCGLNIQENMGPPTV
jgi:hypothetical protein